MAEKENETNYLKAQIAEVGQLKEELALAQSAILELERLLADKLGQIETLREMHEADQKRIDKFGSMIETLWTNEFRQKNELCQLEQRAAQLKSELDTFKEGLGWRIRKRLGLLNTKSP